jgi:hypothetical protein
MKLQTSLIPFQSPPHSLVWEGDTLVDWAAGGNRYALDGTFESANRRFSDRFNGVAALPDGRCAALFERRWTNGILVINDLENPEYTHFRAGERVFSFRKINIREIKRSYYEADAYEYPIALFYLPDGRPAILHCPDEYNRLEIELIETGERLTVSENRNPEDCFHSRLEISPSGRYALSAGWVWHPVDMLWVYDLHQVLEDPRHLDHDKTISHNVGSAAFLDDDLIVYAIIPWPPSEAEKLLGKTQIDLYSIEKAAVIHSVGVDREHISVLPTPSRSYVWDIFNYPKIIDLNTGAIVAECPELITNGPTSSIELNFDQKAHPPFALHPDRRRLAVGTKEGIAIISCSV